MWDLMPGIRSSQEASPKRTWNNDLAFDPKPGGGRCFGTALQSRCFVACHRPGCRAGDCESIDVGSGILADRIGGGLGEFRNSDWLLCRIVVSKRMGCPLVTKILNLRQPCTHTGSCPLVSGCPNE